jgi:hypothetical protein
MHFLYMHYEDLIVNLVKLTMTLVVSTSYIEKSDPVGLLYRACHCNEFYAMV